MNVKIGEYASVALTSAEEQLYKFVKIEKKVYANTLTDQQNKIARTLVDKSILSRKKHNGSLYYICTTC